MAEARPLWQRPGPKGALWRCFHSRGRGYVLAARLPKWYGGQAPTESVGFQWAGREMTTFDDFPAPFPEEK